MTAYFLDHRRFFEPNLTENIFYFSLQFENHLSKSWVENKHITGILCWTNWSNIHLPLLPGNFGYFWKLEAKSINVTILMNKKLLTFCCKSLITLKVNISYWKSVLYSYQPKTKIIRKIRINNLQTFPPQKKVYKFSPYYYNVVIMWRYSNIENVRG